MIRTTKKSITKQRKSMIKKTKEISKYEKLEKMKGIRNTKKKNKDI